MASSAGSAGAAAGATGITLSALLLAGALCLSGREFGATATLVVLWHLPVIPIEALVTAAAVSYLRTVAPHLLIGNNAGEASP